MLAVSLRPVERLARASAETCKFAQENAGVNAQGSVAMFEFVPESAVMFGFVPEIAVTVEFVPEIAKKRG
jgi:hypothetical protein